MSESGITDNRRIKSERGPEWQVLQFDDGEHYMLVASSTLTQFSAHFNAEEFAAFQQLVRP